MRSLLLSGFLSLYKGIDYDLTTLQLLMSASDLMPPPPRRMSQASAGQSTGQTSASQTSGDFPEGVFTVKEFAHNACWNCQLPGPSGVDVCHVAKEDNSVCSYITANLNRS